MEPLAALTALSDLRMRVYSNGDTPLTLHISQLNALTNLQVCDVGVGGWGRGLLGPLFVSHVLSSPSCFSWGLLLIFE
jgi:hypothetical protein